MIIWDLIIGIVSTAIAVGVLLLVIALGLRTKE